MKCKTTIPSVVALLVASASLAFAAPEIPGEPQKEPIALVGGTIHRVNGPAIPNGTLLFNKGKIVAVGAKVEIPKDAKRIDVAGKHVYPGLFDAYTDMGLAEINAVRATRDEQEVGQINPNVKAHVAFNPDSELIPVARSNGVLLTLTAPIGTLIAGRSAVMQLDGWTWEDMTLRSDVALHIQWPNMSPVRSFEVTASDKEQLEARDKAIEKLRQAFADARAYAQARRAPGSKYPTDTRWEAMLPVLDGKLPLLIVAEDAQQIQAAVAFAEQQKARLIIYGGYDAPLCAELLKKHKVPIIVAGVYRLPRRRGDDYDAPYTLPERLRAAGLSFCISGSGRHGASSVRNLPYHAATAAAYGLSTDEALKSITLYPAEILGAADRVGSLEAKKDATLFSADGDILEPPTLVQAAYVQGRAVDLNDRHKRLWKKYEEKYRRQK